MKEGNNIEKLFKDGFENFEVDPGDHLWSKIQSEIPAEGIADAALKSTGAAAKAGGSWLTTVVVGGAIGLVSVAGYYYFENTAEARKTQNESPQNIEEQTDQAVQESEAIDANEVLESASQKDSKVEGNAELNINLTENEPAPSSGSNENLSPSEEAVQTKPTHKPEKEETAIGEDQPHTKQTVTPNQSTTEESITVSESVTDQGGMANTANQSGTEAENSSKHVENSQPNEASDQAPESPKKNTNESKGANSTNESMLNPPSNSVDETPGVIEAYKLPNIFTPNGDGIHDIFQIEFKDLNFDKIEVRIFNRAGNQIHEWSGAYGYWDGKTRDGSLAPEGPYFYTVLITKDDKVYEKKKIVTLSRGQ